MAARPTQTEPRPAPRLYLITPPVADAHSFSPMLAAALTVSDVAAVLLRLAAGDERALIKRTKTLGPPVQEKGAVLVLDGHADLVTRAGCDGAHLTGIAAFNEAVERLKPESIAGCGGLASRHDAMLAAEAGADYVMFGEPDASGRRPSFAAVEERVAWWAEVFEIPCVGYAAARDEIEPMVRAGVDFVAPGDWLWQERERVTATVVELASLMHLPETAS